MKSEVLVVKVLRQVVHVGLHAVAGLDRGTDADVDRSGAQALRRAIGADAIDERGVDAVRRHLLERPRKIGRGNTDAPPSAVTMNDHAGHGVRAREKTPCLVEIASSDRAPRTAGRVRARAVAGERLRARLEPELFSERGEQREIAGPLMTETKILSDHDQLRAKGAAKQLRRKLPRRPLRQLLREWLDHDAKLGIDAKKQLHLSRQRREHRVSSASQHFRRMWMEREHDERQAATLGLAPGSAEHRTVPEVYAVEVPDGHQRRSDLGPKETRSIDAAGLHHGGLPTTNPGDSRLRAAAAAIASGLGP